MQELSLEKLVIATMEVEKKTILVTGGAGFIGTHLCKKLVEQGHSVISLDNYFTGQKENHIDGVDYREGHTKDIDELIPETPDIIYHFGEYARVAPSMDEPERVWDMNITGSLAVLEFWRKTNAKLIYASSSTKFADEREDKVEGRNRAPYSWGKAAITELVHNYGAWYGLDYSVAYFYCVYGPGERAGQFDGGYGTVVETFKQCYLNGDPCTINGSGEQTRAFTHVNDTVSALLILGEKGNKEDYYLCAQEVYSLLELADMFGSEVVFNEPTKTTRSSGCDDTTNLEALGWKQDHQIKDYVEDIKKGKNG